MESCMGNEEIKLARKETHSRGLALTGGNRKSSS